MRGRLAAAVGVGALVVVPVALAGVDGTYTGRTSQGFKVTAQVTDTQVQRINVPWRATDCRPDDDYVVKVRRFVWTNGQNGAMEHSGTRFSDDARVTLGPKDRRAFVKAHLTGKFVGMNRLTGTQRVSVSTDDKFGHHVCKASMKWSAKVAKP